MRQSGFTLVELLVTMSIVAILAAVMVPRLTDAISKAKATEVQMAFSVIAKAQHVHYMETDRYASAATPEEYLATLGVKMNSYKYFDFVTGPEYQQLVAVVEIDGIPMVEDGFWIDGNLKNRFGRLDGDEVVMYNYVLSTGEEKATTEDPILAYYLQSYLFKINGTPPALGDCAVGGPSDDGNNGHGNDLGGYDPSNPGNSSGNNGSNNDHDDNGHGNDADGYDESNPGASTGTNKGGKNK